MNWIPNAEGIRWFLESVWTDVRYEFPDLNIHLAGRMMPDWLLNIRQPGVIIEGEVPDAHQFISSHSVMIVPLFSGSGIRIKIIEAMAAGKAIITTSIGAEGINYVPGHHLLIADNKEQFIECIRKLIIEHDLRKQMGINARQLVLEEHDNAVLINQLTGFYRKISGNPPS
jgi:glycosyltransferase involved in cell wall biosynthesis